MANGISSGKPLNHFIADLLLKHKGKTADKELAKELKTEFPKMKKDLATVVKLIGRKRRSLNKGKLKYRTRVVETITVPAPETPIAEFGAKPAPKAKAEKAKTDKVVKPKMVLKKPSA
jgi:hypothetical protein